MKRREFLKGFGCAGTVAVVAGCRPWRWSEECVRSDVVLGRLSESHRFESLHPLFCKAFSFLRSNDLGKLSLGRHVIDGDNVFANVQDANLKPWNKSAQLEAHRKYIDIQVPITGAETMGYAYDEENVRRHDADYNVKDDCVLFGNPDMRKVQVRPGEFVVFFPPFGAHAPGMTEREPHTIRKVVVKVRATNPCL